MEPLKLAEAGLRNITPTMPHNRRHKTDGTATAALLIQIASEMLETSPTLRKRLGVTLSDLAAANKVRKELIRKTLSVQ